MNAMTWWDWKTKSIWSQPWGTAIAGPLTGRALTLLPASVVPWSTWLDEHPETTVVANDLDGMGRSLPPRGHDSFVIGVALEDWAMAYAYPMAAERRVINDRIGPHPVVVVVDPETRDIKVYLRNVVTRPSGGSAPSEIRFVMDDSGRMVDVETSSVWDPARGIFIDGPLRGTLLQQIPYVTSFPEAWLDFFPHTTFYTGEGKDAN